MPFIIHISTDIHILSALSAFGLLLFSPFLSLFNVQQFHCCKAYDDWLLWSDKWATVCSRCRCATYYATRIQWPSCVATDSQWGRRGLNSAKLSLCLVASNNTSDNDSRKPRRLHLFISRANQSTHKFGWHWEMGAQPLTCPGYIWMAFFFLKWFFSLLPHPLFLFVFKNHFYSTQRISLQLDRFIRDCTCELWSMQQIVIAAYATMPIKDSRWPPAQDGLSCGRLAFHSASCCCCDTRS